mmetsp:Transcript_4671/g.16044  ORF Transcript_4671/g.16044 Transcript_4671/m.16044 type:complete len:214 (-) Transcript_4671:429-1070(-)
MDPSTSGKWVLICTSGCMTSSTSPRLFATTLVEGHLIVGSFIFRTTSPIRTFFPHQSNSFHGSPPEVVSSTIIFALNRIINSSRLLSLLLLSLLTLMLSYTSLAVDFVIMCRTCSLTFPPTFAKLIPSAKTSFGIPFCVFAVSKRSAKNVSMTNLSFSSSKFKHRATTVFVFASMIDNCRRRLVLIFPSSLLFFFLSVLLNSSSVRTHSYFPS